jgi:surface polysaccharide O-acyltransferase-like enzyme
MQAMSISSGSAGLKPMASLVPANRIFYLDTLAGASGPLWFAVALLIFSVIYAVVRLVGGLARDASKPSKTRGDLEITPKAVHIGAAVVMTVIAAGSFLVRLVQPVGTSVYNMQLCFFVSISIGLITLYREKANVRNRGTAVLSDTSFGIYTFHAPFLVAVSMTLRSFAVYPPAKAAIVAAIAFAASLGFAWVIQKVPGLRKVFA